MKWLVIYTKPNFEIRVSQALNAIGIKAYCPTYKKIVQYSDRKKRLKTIITLIRTYISQKQREKVFEVLVLFVMYFGWKPAEVRTKK